MADQFLSLPDRQKLAAVLASIYDFQQGAAARLGYLNNAGLSRFVAGIDLATAPNTLAGILIQRLEPYGPLPEWPTYHALGTLINYVLTQPDTPKDQQKFLADLIVKYSLIADQDYVQQLREQYQLDVVVVRPPDETHAAPRSGVAPTAEPAFAVAMPDEAALELIVNSADNFLDIQILASAIYNAQAVGRIEWPPGQALGTGFLIGPDLLLTNQHVLQSKDYLEQAVVRFDYQANLENVASEGRMFAFDPDFYESSPSTELDFAIARIKEAPLGAISFQRDEKTAEGLSYESLSHLELLRRGRHRGYLLLARQLILKGQRINIVQHPRGLPQKVVLTQNYVLENMSDTRVHYLADTEGGSSGSPVFNHRWEVVALHHSGGPHPPMKLSDSLQSTLKGNYRFNEGIPIRAIAPKIERHLPRS